MPDERELARSAALDRQQAYAKDPWSVHPIFLRPCVIRILMVIDGFGSFGIADFGTKALLDVLATPPGPWVRFEVTKAHRRVDPAADLQNFRFDADDLSEFDEIWLLGVERQGSEISDPEVRSIAVFMDGGGGVFATGDHEDLGVAMCGRVPRVRSMRKWYWPSPGPNGEPVAPKTDGPDRFDTLSAGNDVGVQFDDQSDDVPQRIIPRFYSAGGPWNGFFHRMYPHPLLCGPRGVIRVLPDHPHEGECYEPSDLTAVLTYDGYAVTEYPAGIAPEVVAWSTVHARSAAEDQTGKGVLNARTFGAIGAYDGHRAGVGRVSVDATWHHFFDINLIGALGSQDPIKSVGFDSTTAGHAAYEDIKSYFRNIAIWLAREKTQDCMWWRALWWTRWNHRLVMDLRPHYMRDVSALDLHELLRIGGEARDILGGVASRCTVWRWIFSNLLKPVKPKLWEELQPQIDPWYPRPPLPDPQPPERQPDPEPARALHAELLGDVLLGAAIYALGTQFPTATEEARNAAEDLDFPAHLGDHIHHAVDLVGGYLTRESESLDQLARTLRS